MSLEFELTFDDIKPSTLKRMLAQAVRTEKNRSLPLHKRKSKEELVSEDDDATEESDAEMDKLADLSEEKKGKAADVALTDEDMSDEAMEELTPPKKAPKKPGKKA